MSYGNVGNLEEELGRVRALRANPPPIAANDDRRRKVFSAALEQFEQLLRAAEISGPASAPLPLFYALSQAGRAIAAARMNDPQAPERWDYVGHGLGGAAKYSAPIGAVPVTPHKGNAGAFQVVSEATRSPAVVARRPLEMGELWASLPSTRVGEGLGADLPRPLQLHPGTGSSYASRHAAIEAPVTPGTDPVEDLQKRYPASRALRLVVQELPGRTDRVKAGVFWPLGGRPLGEITETYWSESAFYLRPAIAGEAPPSILMTWWAVLFGLSHLARYAPAVWTASIAPDTSTLTVPIEHGLRLAKRCLPRLVYHAVTGSWGSTD
jgi:hypothetical protein